jgi:hypothetical protein
LNTCATQINSNHLSRGTGPTKGAATLVSLPFVDCDFGGNAHFRSYLYMATGKECVSTWRSILFAGLWASVMHIEIALDIDDGSWNSASGPVKDCGSFKERGAQWIGIQN